METTVNGVDYSIASMDAFTQLRITKRIAPLSVVIDALNNPENDGKDFTMVTVLMLSNLSDADHDFIVHTCLSYVRRKDGDKYARILNDAGSLMYKDITMEVMVNLVTEVIKQELGGFFHTALSRMSTGGAAQVKLSKE